MWDDELDDVTRATLIRAYARRKRWEAQLLAGEVAQLLAGRSRPKAARANNGNDGQERWVHPDEFLRLTA